METACVTLFKEAPEANMRRQYSIEVVRDLFGANVVVCRWGRIGTHGQRREHVCASNDEAQVFAAKLVRKREARGYARHRASRRVMSARRATIIATPRPVRATRRRGRHNDAQLTLWVVETPVAAGAPPSKEITAKTARMPCQLVPFDAQFEAQRQARIECVLAVSRRLATRSCTSLQVTRASELTPTHAMGSSYFYEREMAIEKAIGVPHRGRPLQRQRRLC